jgi:hypothetical protein
MVIHGEGIENIVIIPIKPKVERPHCDFGLHHSLCRCVGGTHGQNGVVWVMEGGRRTEYTSDAARAWLGGRQQGFRGRRWRLLQLKLDE